jgi:hypothetical protein
MVGALQILNPRRRRRRSKRIRSRRNPRRKMTAKQLQYFGPRRRRRRVSASTRRRAGRRRRRETVIVAASNPRRRRRRYKMRIARRRRSGFLMNPRRRYRRNPRGGEITGFLADAMVPAVIGAAGALAVDLIIGNTQQYLPSTLTTGMALPLVRMGASLLLGVAVGMAAGPVYGGAAAAGGMIVTVYGMAKNYIQQNYPQVQLARYVGVGRYLGYVRRRRVRLGRIIRRRRRLNGFYVRPVTLGNGIVRRRRRRLAGVYANQINAARFNRNGRNLGYIGPARTLGRYVK